MPFKYIKTNFLSKEARRWWRNYITGSDVMKGLGKFFAVCFIIQGLFFQKPIYALLIIFAVATLSFAYSIFYMGSKIMNFVLTELYPNDGLTAYFLIGVGGLIFGSMILLPALFAISRVADAPVNWLSFLVTYSYALPVWSFFEVSKTVKRNVVSEQLAKRNAAELKSVKTHQQSQSEAISELSPETVQKINDLTAVKDIKRVAERK